MPKTTKKKSEERATAAETRRKVIPARRRMHQISQMNLLDLLSEMLALQRNSLQLLTLARDRAMTPDLRESLERFVETLEARADEIQTAIRDLDGNPVFVSPAAQVQHQRMESMAGLSVPSRLQQVVHIENCWYASIQENLHLAFLRSVLPFLESIHAQDLLEDILERARSEHEDRIEWLEQTLHRVLLQRAILPIDDEELRHAA